jgi:hypothetical protein
MREGRQAFLWQVEIDLGNIAMVVTKKIRKGDFHGFVVHVGR